jgi:hypothetical protein
MPEIQFMSKSLSRDLEWDKNTISLIAGWENVVALIHGYFPHVFLAYRNNTFGSWLPDRINVAASWTNI